MPLENEPAAAPRAGRREWTGGAMRELGALARTIIDSNAYMVLGTADETRRPRDPVLSGGIGLTRWPGGHRTTR
jgi:hypothetical protein